MQCVTFNEQSELVGDDWLYEVVEVTHVYASVTPRARSDV